MATYGDTQIIIRRTGAEPADFGFEKEDEPDAELEAFVDELRERASSEVERYCDQVFARFDEHVDVLRGTNRRAIRTRNAPVLEIHSIAVGSSPLEADDYRLVSAPGWPDEQNGGEIERTDRRVWPRGRDVEIVYDWGFEEPPSAVDSVVEDLVVETLERAEADRLAEGTQSESMDGYSVQWDVASMEDYLTLTESMQAKLDSVRRTGVS